MCSQVLQLTVRLPVLLHIKTWQHHMAVLLCLQVAEDPHAGIAWVSGEGQVYCISKGFAALLGYTFQDLRRNIQTLGQSCTTGLAVWTAPCCACNMYHCRCCVLTYMDDLLCTS